MKKILFIIPILMFFFSLNVKAADCTNLFDTANFNRNNNSNYVSHTLLTNDSFSAVSTYSKLEYQSSIYINFKIPSEVGNYIISYDLEYSEEDLRALGSSTQKYYTPYILFGDPNNSLPTSYINFEKPSNYLTSFPTHFEYEYEVVSKVHSNYLLAFYTYSYGNYPVTFKNIKIYKKEDYETCAGQAPLYTLTFNISPISSEYVNIEITDGDNLLLPEEETYKLESNKKYNISISANGYETYKLLDYSINEDTTLDIELQLLNSGTTESLDLVPYLILIAAILMFIFMTNFIKSCFKRRF